MELMELVENEPTSRPFQCDWQACNKVSFNHPTAVLTMSRKDTNPQYRASTASRTCKDITAFTQMSDLTLALHLVVARALSNAVH